MNQRLAAATASSNCCLEAAGAGATTVSVAGHKAYLGKPATTRIWGRILTA